MDCQIFQNERFRSACPPRVALAQGLGNSTEQTYTRSDLFERRRTLMQLWADYVTDKSNGSRNGRVEFGTQPLRA